MANERTMQFRPKWIYDPEKLPAPVNQFMMQIGLPTSSGAPGDVVLTFGYANPPAIIPDGDGGFEVLGTEDGSLPVSPTGHFALSIDRLIELRDTITNWLESNPSASISSNPL